MILYVLECNTIPIILVLIYFQRSDSFGFEKSTINIENIKNMIVGRKNISWAQDSSYFTVSLRDYFWTTIKINLNCLDRHWYPRITPPPLPCCEKKSKDRLWNITASCRTNHSTSIAKSDENEVIKGTV